MCLFLSGFASGQVYTFEKEEMDYQPLVDAITISGNKPWSDTVFSIPIGFDFTVYQKTYDTCHLVQGFAFFGHHLKDYSVGDTAILLATFDLDLYDLGYDSLGTSLSPVKYKTTGSPGNQIFIIEYNKAWWDIDDKTRPFFDFQLWFYEYNGTMEIRYGPAYYPWSAPSGQMVGLSMMKATGVDTFRVIQQTRLNGLDDAIFLDVDLDPGVEYTFIPRENTVFRFLYDRDIIFNNVEDFGLMSGLSNDYDNALQGSHGALLPDSSAMMGHGYRMDTEWAERYIFQDSVVLKGLVSQHYGFTTVNDTAYYNIYLPGPDLLPGISIRERRISFFDLDLTGHLNHFGFDPPLVIKDTFFVSFGIPPYRHYSDNAIGLFFTGADEYREGIMDYGRTAVRFMDGQWYDMYTAFYNTGDLLNNSGLGSVDLVHLSLAPVVNFFTRNRTPLQDHVQDLNILHETYAESKEIRLFPHYPNPAEEYLYINYMIHSAGKTELSVFNVAGQLFYKTDINTQQGIPANHLIEVGDWPAGEYIYILQNRRSKISAIFTKLK